MKPMVSMAQFLDDDRYMGRATRGLYPQLRKDLIQIAAAPRDWIVLAGGMGSGTATVGRLLVARMVYEAACEPNLREKLFVCNERVLKIPVFALNLVLSSRLLDAIWGEIKESPWMQEVLRPVRKRDEIAFANGVQIQAASSRATHIEWRSIIIGAFVVNGPHVVELEEKVRRVKTAGTILGAVIDDKPSKSLVEEAEVHEVHDERVFIHARTTWEIQERDYYDPDGWFRVLVQDKREESRVLRPREQVHPWRLVIEVPGEYREDFERDMKGALRDIAGVE